MIRIQTNSIIVSVIYAFCILLVVTSVPDTNIYTDWHNIKAEGLIRSLTSIGVSFFLPGFVIISFLCKNIRTKILLKTLLSYLTSFVLSGFIGFVIGYGDLPITYIRPVIVIVNIILLVAYIYQFVFRPKLSSDMDFVKFIKNKLYIIIVFCCLITLVITWTYLLYDLKIIGDQWFHHGRSLVIMSNSMAHLSSHNLDAQYPPFFSSALSSFFYVSGISSVNAYVLLNIFNFIPILSFFYFYKEYVPIRYKKAKLLATTLFVISGGFGWTYVIYLIIVNSPETHSTLLNILHYGGIRTFDIRMPSSFIGVGHPDITSPLLTIGLPAGLVLLGVTRSDLLKGYKGLTLILIVILSGSLFHDEFNFFIIIGCLVPIILRLGNRNIVYLAASLGFVIEIIIDLCLPYNYYTTRDVMNIPILYLLIIYVLIMWILYVTKIYLKLANQVIILFKNWNSTGKQFLLENRRFLFILGLGLLVYLYSFTFLVWSNLSFSEIQLQTSDQGQRVVPWYLYPGRLGLCGFLGIAFVISYLNRRFDSGLWIFVVISIAAFVLAPFYDELRFSKYVELGMVCLAALLLTEIIERIKINRRPIISSLLISSVLLGSGMSVILYMTYSSLGIENHFAPLFESLPRRIFPSNSEMAFLNTMHLDIVDPKTDFASLPAREMVPNQGLSATLEGFVDLSITKFAQNPYILNSTTLEGLFSLLSKGNVNLLVIPREYDRLFSGPIKFVLDNLYKAYEDQKFEVFSVPALNPPTRKADIGLIYQPQGELTFIETQDLNYSNSDIPNATKEYRKVMLSRNDNSTITLRFSMPTGYNFAQVKFRTLETFGKANNAGLVWRQGDVEQYVLLRNNVIGVYNPTQGEYTQQEVLLQHQDWNTLAIARFENSTQVFLNGQLLFLIPQNGNNSLDKDNSINEVGIRLFNQRAEFFGITIGKVQQNNNVYSEVANFYAAYALALSNNSYDVFQPDDPASHDKKTLIVPSDLVTAQHLSFAEKGSTLIVLVNNEGAYYLSDQVKLKKDDTHNFSKIRNMNGLTINASGRVAYMESNNLSSSETSWFFDKQNKVSPFTISSKRGLGKLIFVNWSPYNGKNVNDSGTSIHALPYLAQILGINSQNVIPPPQITAYAIPRFVGEMSAVGKINLSAESILLNSTGKLKVDEVRITDNDSILVTKNATIPSILLSGSPQVTIAANEIRLPISSNYDYITIRVPTKFDLFANLSNSSSLEVYDPLNRGTFTASYGGVSLYGVQCECLEDLDIVVKRPRIQINGTVHFERLFSNDPNDYSKQWVKDERVVADGSFDLNITHSDEADYDTRSNAITYLDWNSFVSELPSTLRIPADISMRAKYLGSETHASTIFFSEANLKNLILILGLSFVAAWIVRPGQRSSK